jgi:putative ABC transport system permease protein
LNYENSYDNWDKGFEKIYRAGRSFTPKDLTTSTSPPFGPLLQSSSPEIDKIVRVRHVWTDVLLKTDKGDFYERNYFKVDSTFFELFPYKLKYGNIATALKKPEAIILSTDLSEKLFGSINPLGKRIQINGDKFREVTGVLETPPGPCNLKFEALTLLQVRAEEGFGYNNLTTYLTFKKNPSNLAQLESSISDNITRVLKPELAKDKNGEINYMFGDNGKANVFFEQLKNIHLYARDGSYKNRHIINQSLAFIAFAIILLVCLNFSGLSIALIARRMKENTVKYIFGHQRLYLMLLQLIETFIQCIIALIIAFVLVELCINGFNNLLNVKLQLSNSLQLLSLVPKLLIGIVAMVLISGLYPAYILSKLSPSEILKGQFSSSKRGIFTRKLLITVQLAITILFLGGGLIIYQQIHFLQQKDLGFQAENVLVAKINADEAISKYGIIKTRLLTNPEIISVSCANSYPADNKGCSGNTYHYKEIQLPCCYTEVDVDYFESLGIPVIEGRTFKAGYKEDSTLSLIINEAALKLMNTKTAVNEFMTQENYADTVTGKMYPLRIIGVVKNFHRNKFEEEIHPTIYAMTAPSSGEKDRLIIKYKSENPAALVNTIESILNEYNKPFPVRFEYLSQNVDNLMDDYYKYGKIFLILISVSLLISSIGLIALISYTVSIKAREISVRKVLGASYSNIIRLFQKEYIVFVVLAAIIAIPLVIIGGNIWLETFVYRISMPLVGIILLAGMVIVFILVLIRLQINTFAKAKPISYLKYE